MSQTWYLKREKDYIVLYRSGVSIYCDKIVTESSYIALYMNNKLIASLDKFNNNIKDVTT